MDGRRWAEGKAYAEAAVAIQRIARGRAARRAAIRKKLHTVTGNALVVMLESVRLSSEHAAASARISNDLDRLPVLVPSMAAGNALSDRVAAAKDAAFVLCEAQGANATKAFALVESTDIAARAEALLREMLAAEALETGTVYPLLAIVSNLPTLGGTAGEQLLTASGCLSLMVDCLSHADVGVQHYATSAVCSMAHDAHTVDLLARGGGGARLEALLLESDDRHIASSALMALDKVRTTAGGVDLPWARERRALSERSALTDLDQRRRVASTQIQKWARGFLGRTALRRELNRQATAMRAAARVQAHARGRHARRAFVERRRRSQSARAQLAGTRARRALRAAAMAALLGPTLRRKAVQRRASERAFADLARADEQRLLDATARAAGLAPANDPRHGRGPPAGASGGRVLEEVRAIWQAVAPLSPSCFLARA
ncbi:hypothetical protein KFE25_012986 [Diacronema lutheri]|uniref:Uncharacterized protein n=1 Tax=Diacronema lutheri TaxID=2081491 RepID=A0A8J6C6X6_DIALT|nr:hypothetical protein KFE25_012986 [Diacronema lutheri]